MIPGNENVKTVSPLSDLIQDGGIPSINQIVREVGEDLVDRIYFAIATFFTEKRESEHAYARHVVDPMIRDVVWDLKYRNPDPTNTVLVTHDDGEVIGKTLPGARIINRWNGLIFGGDFEVAGNFMTDYDSIIVKAARSQSATTNYKESEDITIRDVIEDIRSVKKILVSSSRIAQDVALDGVFEQYQYFRGALEKTDIPIEDKKYIIHLVEKWENNLEETRKHLESEDELKRYTGRRVSRLIDSIEKHAEVGEYSFFDDDGSAAYHAARIAAYKLYTWRLVNFGGFKEAKKVTAFNHYNLRGGKKGDSADNLRTPKSHHFKDLARLHLKGKIYIETEEEKLALGQDSLEKENARYELDFLKGQYAYRVIHDTSNAGLHNDSSFGQVRDWNTSRFIGLEGVVGDRFMEDFRDILKKRPNELAIPEETADNMVETYDRLLKPHRKDKGLLRRITGSVSGLGSKAASFIG